MGYTESDKKEFLALHLTAFACFAFSAGFAFHLAPPDGRMHDSIFVENTKYEILANGDTGWVSTKKNIIENVNAIRLMAWTLALSAGSHFVAGLMMLGSKGEPNDVYNGKSRSAEYIRRCVSNGVIDGLLIFTLLVGQGELNFIILLTALVGNVAIQLIRFYNDAHDRDKKGPLSVLPSIVGFVILGGGIMLLSFKAANNASVLPDNKDAEAHQYDLLTILFSAFYGAIGIHQLICVSSKYYAKTWDMDKIHVVLELTSKTVLAWAFITITRASADELNKKFDGKVSFEGKNPKSNMLSYYGWIRWGLLIAAGIVWLIMWGCDGPLHPRNKGGKGKYQELSQAPEDTTLDVSPDAEDEEEDEEEVNEYMPSRVGRRRRAGLNF